MVTIKDISKKSGFSPATVSKALNGYGDVSPKTQEKIRQIADQLHYMPNSAARLLKTNRSHNIGVVFEDETLSGLTHDYFSRILNSAKNELERRGYDITFIGQKIGGSSFLEHLRYRNCDGVLIANVDFTADTVLELIHSEIPAVTIDYIFDNISSVLSDNVEGIDAGTEFDKVATTYIIASGSRLDIQMAKATLISKIEIEPYGVETVPVISVTPATLKLIPGATAKLTASVSPTAETQWKSSNEAVATVAADGTVTAVAAGEATITNYWQSASSDATAEASCVISVADVDLSAYTVAKSYDFTTMGDVTLVLQTEAAGAIWNAANSKNNDVFFCTNEGLDLLAVQAAADAGGKGWSIVDGQGLFLGTGAGRCAAIGGIKAGQIVVRQVCEMRDSRKRGI